MTDDAMRMYIRFERGISESRLLANRDGLRYLADQMAALAATGEENSHVQFSQEAPLDEPSDALVVVLEAAPWDTERDVGEDASGMGWCDSQLMGHLWRNDGKDLWLDVVHGAGRRGVIKCTWAAELELAITYRANQGGPVLAWEVEFVREDRRWSVRWDFGSNGTMSFTCEKAVFVAAASMDE